MPDFTIRDPTSGKTLTVRGDSPPSEQELIQLFAAADQPQASHTPAPSTPHPNQELYDTMQGIGSWAAKAIGGAFMGPPGVDAAEHPGMTLASAAVPVAAKVVPGLVARGLGVSSQRAAQNLQDAATAAKGVPINVEKVGEQGLRAIDLQATGARMPRAATQFMRRITDPAQGEMTFEEARDFYSNLSRLSANEYNTLNPTMQRQIALMKQALHEALTEGAETVGKGSQYASGIKEYARAAKFASGAKTAGKAAAKYAVPALGLGALGKYAIDMIPSH